jgi:hypothetical protein
MFTATVSLTAADIDGAAQLGFIDIGLQDGHAVGLLTASFTPTNNKTYGRITGLASQPVPIGQTTAYSGNVTVELVKAAGFEGAVSTSNGAARIGSDPYQIPRFTPWDMRMPAFAVRMWSNLAHAKPDYAAA